MLNAEGPSRLRWGIGADRADAVCAVVQYLADQKPGWPYADARECRALSCQQWLAFISTELHKQFNPLFKSNTPDATKETQKELPRKRIGFVDKSLDGKTYLMGETFTAADAYAFTVLNSAERVGLDVSAFGNVSRFMGSVAARPGVQQALREEGQA